MDLSAMTHALKSEVNVYGELTIYSVRGDILYEGKPEGYPVERAQVYENEHVIVLLKHWKREKDYGAFENLLLLGSDGAPVWHAELPKTTSGEAYVRFEVIGGKLFANSWSCYRVEISMRTGKIVQSEFTK